MKKLIAIATSKDKRSMWHGHFGVSPVYSIFNAEGKLIEQRENPLSKDKHHDDPLKVKSFLSDIHVFIGRNMGQKSRKKLTEQLGVKTFLVDKEDIFSAITYYLETEKNVEIFNKHTSKYEEWFEKNKTVYKTEINMLKNIIPQWDKAIEIGIGSGRFASPLGIKEGVEPSEKMTEIAKEKGLKVYPGFAENLPILDEEYDLVFMAVTICFVKDPKQALKESYRILKCKGKIIVAIIDKNTKIGKEYISKKSSSTFYKNVNFFSTEELINLMRTIGFKKISTHQTLFGENLKDIKEIQSYKSGHGEGAFVAIIGEKPC